MDIGKLPTDNLYKFIAIGGLVLFLFGLGFTLAFNFQIDRLQLEEKNRIRQESIKFGPLAEKEASIIRQMDYLDKIARRKYLIKSIDYTDLKTDSILANIYEYIEEMDYPDSKKDSLYSAIFYIDQADSYSKYSLYSDIMDTIQKTGYADSIMNHVYSHTIDLFYTHLIDSGKYHPIKNPSLAYHDKASYYSAMDFSTLKELKPLKDEYESLNIDLETVREEIEINKEYLNYEKEGIQLERDRLLKGYKGYYIVVFLGVALLIAGLMLWYYKTQRILDKKLKNESNFDKLFEYRYHALKELSLMYYRVYPKKMWEDMDEYEAYQNVTLNQNQINNLIKNYLNEHSAILDPEEIKAFRDLELISNDLRFEVNEKDLSVTPKGVNLSKDVINKLKLILDNMKSKFDKEYK